MNSNVSPVANPAAEPSFTAPTDALKAASGVEQHYRPSRFCEIAQISLATFWRRVKVGDITVKRPPGRVVLVAASELTRYLNH